MFSSTFLRNSFHSCLSIKNLEQKLFTYRYKISMKKVYIHATYSIIQHAHNRIIQNLVKQIITNEKRNEIGVKHKQSDV